MQLFAITVGISRSIIVHLEDAGLQTAVRTALDICRSGFINRLEAVRPPVRQPPFTSNVHPRLEVRSTSHPHSSGSRVSEVRIPLRCWLVCASWDTIKSFQ